MNHITSLLRPSLTVGSFTLLSRVTGFIRDVMIAQFLGTGLLADCFLAAFRFTGFFSQIFAEGAFPSAFVPLFSSVAETQGPQSARRFADQVYSWLALSAACFCLLMILAMPWAMALFVPGLDDTPGKQELAVELARIAFPYLFFASLVALLSGLLNSLGRFAAAAAAMSILNLGLVATLVILAPSLQADHALAWGTLLAGSLQVLWLMAAVQRTGFRPRFTTPHLTSDIRLLLKRIRSTVLGSALTQVSVLTDTMFASLLPTGALSALYYAERVNQLPLGVVSIAIGTALLPLLSRQLASGDHAAASYSQNRALEAAMFLVLPAACGLAALAQPIVSLLFVHGEFSADNALTTSHALEVYAIGAPAAIAVRIFSSAFFARGDTKTPVFVGLAAFAIDIALNLLLMPSLALVAIALSNALSAIINALLLGLLLARRHRVTWDRRLWRRLGSMALACGLMLGLLLLLRPLLPESGKLIEALSLGGAILLGGGVYGLVAWRLKIIDGPLSRVYFPLHRTSLHK